MLLHVDYDPVHVEAQFRPSTDFPRPVWARLRQIVLAVDASATITADRIVCPWVSALAVIPSLSGLRQQFGIALEASPEAGAHLRTFRDQRRAVDEARARRPAI